MGTLVESWGDWLREDRHRNIHTGTEFLEQWEERYPLCGKTMEELEAAVTHAAEQARLTWAAGHIMAGSIAFEGAATASFWKALGQEPQEDPNGPEVTLHLSEIKRLEAERDAYHAQRDKYLQANVDIGKERDEARAEVERLKARTDEDVRAIAEAAMLGYFEGPGCMAVGLPEPSRSSGIKAALAEARKRRPHGTWVAFEKGDQVRSWGPDGIDGKIHDVRLAILVKQGTKHRLEHWGVECATLKPLPPEPEEKCQPGHHTACRAVGDKFCRECGQTLWRFRDDVGTYRQMASQAWPPDFSCDTQ